MKQPYKVWDRQHQRMTQYTPKEVYKLVVDYPGTNRQLEFLGMDRGSCIMQAEVAKEEGDTVMLTVSEEQVTLYNKQEIEI